MRYKNTFHRFYIGGYFFLKGGQMFKVHPLLHAIIVQMPTSLLYKFC